MRGHFLLSILGCLLCAIARADSPLSPGTYKTVSANGKFVFVMIPPGSLETELEGYNDEHKKVVKSIRDVYSKTGLYKNDGSKEPLWTVDWYAFGVVAAPDGIHLVRAGGWPLLEEHLKGKDKSITKGDLMQTAIMIYANGKLLRQYSIGDLVDEPSKLPMSVSHFEWLKESRIIDGKGQFEMLTYDGNRIVVNLATAKIADRTKIK